MSYSRQEENGKDTLVFVSDADIDAAAESTAAGKEGGVEDAAAASESSSSSGGAYNPETGEINWDCPCLGGMASGPCGEEFKAAFSCFVYSKEEPKGVDCVEKFQGMRDCFREHPDVYASDLTDDDDDDDDDEEEEEEKAEKGEREEGADVSKSRSGSDGSGNSEETDASASSGVETAVRADATVSAIGQKVANEAESSSS